MRAYIPCRQGGIAITLLDSLDTLLVMNRRDDALTAVAQIESNVDFDRDAKVHVFETNIRALGGLLSAHVLLFRDAGCVEWHSRCNALFKTHIVWLVSGLHKGVTNICR